MNSNQVIAALAAMMAISASVSPCYAGGLSVSATTQIDAGDVKAAVGGSVGLSIDKEGVAAEATVAAAAAVGESKILQTVAAKVGLLHH